jgi:hypothetical protein
MPRVLSDKATLRSLLNLPWPIPGIDTPQGLAVRADKKTRRHFWRRVGFQPGAT